MGETLDVVQGTASSQKGIDDRNDFTFYMGKMDFTWMPKKQQIVTLFTCEAKYVTAISCVCHAIWLRNMLCLTCKLVEKYVEGDIYAAKGADQDFCVQEVSNSIG